VLPVSERAASFLVFAFAELSHKRTHLCRNPRADETKPKRILTAGVSGEPDALCLPLARLGRWQGQIIAEIFPTISDS
jgi:hypothetical protein